MSLWVAIILTITIVITVSVFNMRRNRLRRNNHKHQQPLTIRTKKNKYQSDTSITTNTGYIPVWTYWDGNMSNLVDICLTRIAKSCAATLTHKHHHITKSTICKYIKLEAFSCYHEKTTMKSDLLRLALLNKYGGIWLDASVYILAPVQSLFEGPDNSPFFRGYFNPSNSNNVLYPVIEVAAMYSSPGNPLVHKWLSKIQDMTSCLETNRRVMVKKMGISKHITNLVPAYHFVYFCLQEILREDINGIQNYNNVVLMNTVITKWFYKYSWRNENILHLTKDEISNSYNNLKMIKFVRSDRGTIDRKIKQGSIFECFLEDGF